jgi:hypothetical protein
MNDETCRCSSCQCCERVEPVTLNAVDEDLTRERMQWIAVWTIGVVTLTMVFCFVVHLIDGGCR